MKNLKIAGLFTFFILLLGSCSEEEPFVSQESSFNYSLHNGQAIPSIPYAGVHPADFEAVLSIQENEDGTADVTVELMNTIIGATYHIHAHDAADPSTTPNSTPYDETPNSDLLAQMVEGNGNTVSVTQTTNMSYSEITSNYEGFFVVHDPLQLISTTDISTYLVVGSFARDGGATDLNTSTFSYSFNTGQVDPSLAYGGTHPSNFEATIQVDYGNRIKIMSSIL